MRAGQTRDPIYLACVVLLAVCAAGFFLFNSVFEQGAMRLRPPSAILSLLLALALLFRARPGMRPWTLSIGLVVMLLCGAQLAIFVVVGHVSTPAASEPVVSQNFAAGLFWVGAALVIDTLLPERWGRHLVLGLIGAIVAGIGVLGVLGLLAGMLDAPGNAVWRGMRLPSALILVFAGTALLAGARLRSFATSGTPPASGEDVLRDYTGLVAGLVMLCVALGATALIWREATNHAERQSRLAASQSLDRLAAALAANALDSVTLLDGLRGLFDASQSVNDREWSRYIGNMRIAERFVGVIAVAHITEVRKPAVATDGSLVHEIDGAQVRIWPAGARDRYFPLVRITPDTPLTRRMLGFDVGSDALHRATLEVAEANGVAAMSGRIDFERYSDPQARSGFVIVKPVPRNPGHAAGFVYSAVDIGAVIDRAAADSGIAALSIEVSDVDAPQGAAPLFRASDFGAANESLAATIEVADRTWSVRAQQRVDASSAESGVPSVILGAGSLCALILFAITWVLAGHRARAMHLAAKMTTELRKSQRAQQAITDTANAGIITADSDGNILYMNPSAAQSFGVEGAQLVGQPLTVLMPERFRDLHRSGLARVAAGGSVRAIGQNLEMAALRSDGSEFPIEILLSVWTSDGQTYFTAFVRDITQRHEAQTMLMRKTRELERSNADLEQFAYVASHDLQEPLRMVASYVQLLARRYRGRLDQDADEFIGFAVDGATRMQRLIQDLLAYARVGRSGQTPIATQVGHCAEAATAHLQEAILESGASVHIDADCEACVVPSQLIQVFQNLIGNALKFRDERVPEIRIDSTAEDGYCHVRVHDNGIGIEPQHRERVFTIFQRLHTRREYAGTGVGLAICRKIVEGSGGKIWVESAPGAGSTFHFTIPAIEDKA